MLFCSIWSDNDFIISSFSFIILFFSLISFLYNSFWCFILSKLISKSFLVWVKCESLFFELFLLLMIVFDLVLFEDGECALDGVLEILILVVFFKAVLRFSFSLFNFIIWFFNLLIYFWLSFVSFSYLSSCVFNSVILFFNSLFEILNSFNSWSFSLS